MMRLSTTNENTMLEQFFEQVKNVPYHTAVITESGNSYSYQDVQLISNKIAFSLMKSGVKAGTLIAVMLAEPFDFLVTTIAVWKLKSAFLPIDTVSNNERKKYIIEDSGAELLIIDESIRGRSLCKNVVIFNELLDVKITTEYNSSIPEMESTACLFYSQGASGLIKKISVSHANLSQVISARIKYFNVPERIGLFYSTEVAMATAVMSWSIATGGTLIMPAQLSSWHSDSIVKLIKTQQVTQLVYPALLYKNLLKCVCYDKLASLKMVMLSGEGITKKLLQIHSELCTEADLYGEYQLAEFLCSLSTIKLYDSKTQEISNISLGKPLENMSMYLFDKEFNELSNSTVADGEIYISGLNLTFDYINSDQQIRSYFVQHPAIPQKLIFKTGDVGRYSNEGEIEYLGRLENRVAIQGEYLILEEIEQLLCEQPEIHQVAILVCENSIEEPHLIAFLKLESGTTDVNQVEREIRRSLSKQFPVHMIPKLFIFVEYFETTLNGKINKASLQIPKINKSLENISVKFRTEIEEKLAKIWCEILQIEQVGINDNFFELGGDSILSIQMVSKARQFGIELSMEQVFEAQTIAELAVGLKTMSNDLTLEKSRSVPDKFFQLSPIQKWYFEKEFYNQNHYNQSILLSSYEKLEPDLIEKSLQIILKTHQSLCLRFKRNDEGKWQQYYEKFENLFECKNGICRIIDMEGYSSDEAYSKRLDAMNEMQKSLNITTGPIIQGTLFKGDETYDTLFLVVHHLVIDSVSWQILLNDLEIVYKKQLEGESKVEVQPEYRNYAWWVEQLNLLANDKFFSQERKYWEAVLYQESMRLPALMEKSAENIFEHTAEIQVSLLPIETRQLLQEVPRSYGTQINEVLLTALSMAIRDWSGSDQLSIWLEGHGRGSLTAEMDLSRSIGWFTSLFPINIDLREKQSISERLKCIKEYLKHIPNKGVGYGILRYLSNEKMDPLNVNREPVISFNYFGQMDNYFQKNIFQIMNEPSGLTTDLKNRRLTLVEINSEISSKSLRARFEYNKYYFNKESIQQLADAFITSLKAIIEHCCVQKCFGYTPSDFPLAELTQDQLDKLFNHPGIEDIYPLSPMQEGLLFQKLLNPNSNAYLVQDLFIIKDKLNIKAFKEAWQFLVNNYEALRTGFKWVGLTRSLQFVQRNISINCTEHDWQSFPVDTIQQKINDLLIRDRQQDFDYERPPLMRLHLITASSELYYLVLSFHHILLDGWCASILISDLLTTYSRLIESRIPKIEPRKSYRSFIEWLKAYDYQEAKLFWKKYLEGVSTTSLSKAVVKIGTSKNQNEFGNFQYVFSDEDSKRLREFSRRQKITLNTLFQTAWHILLRYYTQQEDITSGVVLSGRSIPIEGIEKMIGLFINTLPMRTQLKADITIKNLLDEVGNHSLRLQKQSHIPLYEILNFAQIKEQNMLFDTIFIFENHVSMNNEENGQLNFEPVHTYEPTEYPLAFLIAPNNSGILLDFTYKTECFTEEKLRTMSKHFENIILSITKDLNERVVNINPITEDEKNLVLNVWNNTDVQYLDQKIHQLFEEQVTKTPENIALVYNDDSIKFYDLNAKANQLANYFQEQGLKLGQPVAVCLPRSSELIISLLAILKAGAVYVPIDPIYPIDRIKYMVKDCMASFIIISKKNDRIKNNINIPVISIEDLELSKYSTDNLSTSFEVRDADIIYTSGSTGKPKGILQTHKARLNRFQWMWDKYPFDVCEVCCQKTPISFGDSIWEILGPLLKGIKLVILPDDLRDAVSFISELSRHSVTRIVTVPSMLQSMVDVIHLRHVSLNSLKICTVSGEACPVTLAKKFLNMFPETLLLNIYGSTEFCADATYYEVSNFDSVPVNLPIGKPFSNFQTLILDKSLNLLAPGVVGELCISGVGVADGYLNNEELTNEKFIKNIFSNNGKYHRLFRTGDLARYLPDGNIEYLGRNDSQVKIRGCRIELGEVQTVLISHPMVKEAVVVVKGVQLDDKHLVAYIIANDAATDDKKDLLKDVLLDYMREKVPPYMVPGYIVVLNEFPLTPNGKTDLQKLRSENFVKTSNQRNSQPPQNELEENLCKIWSKLLDFDVNNINLNFFEIGGHSILATKLILQIRQTLGIELQVKSIFLYSTIAELSKHIKGLKQKDNPQTRLFDIQAVSRKTSAVTLEEELGNVY